MHNLPKPDINFEEFFDKYFLKKGQVNLKEKFSLINSAAKEYDTKANICELYKLKAIPIHELLPITPDDLRRLYRNKLSQKTSPARAIYDEILSCSKRYQCGFCSYGEPTELDHFLPQSNFPEFAILPVNLVPICHKCNLLKSNTNPTSFMECYVHPYYEDYKNIQWLIAELQFENNVPIVTFKINDDLKEKNLSLFHKLRYQFDQLDLNIRYSACSNAMIAEIYLRLKELKEIIGANAVKEHLLEEANYSAHDNKNSWRCVLYKNLGKSTQFCEVLWIF